MKVTYPSSIQTLSRLDLSDVHVAMSWGMKSPDYLSSLALKRTHGEKVYVVGRYADEPIKVDGAIGADPARLGHKGEEFGYVIRDVETYAKAVADPDVTFLPIGAERDPYARPLLFNEIVLKGKFCSDKPHWVYGVPNPAELGAYKALFSNYILSKIVLAVASSCFLYSAFGARFSTVVGRMEKIPCIEDHKDDLGMGSSWLKYDMSKEQLRVFYRNQETIQAFADGQESPEFNDHLRAVLEGVVDEPKSILSGV